VSDQDIEHDEHDENIESDLEREHIRIDIIDHLDNIEEILDNSTIDAEEDEQFIEIADLINRIKDIIK